MFTLKSSKKLLFVIALMMAAVLTFSSCLPAKQTFSSVSDEHKSVQAEALKDGVDEFIEILEDLSAKKSGANGGEVSLDLELSNEALNMIKLFVNTDLSWLSSIGAKLSFSTKDQLTGIGASLNLAGSELLALDAILDMENGMAYATVPEIIKKYLAVDIGSVISDVSFGVNTDSLPDAKKVEKLLDKYIDLAVKALGDAEKTSGTLSANGVEQSCDIYETFVDEAVLKNILSAVATEAQNDNDLKNVIIALADFAAKSMEASGQYVDFDSEEIYDEFSDLISDALEFCAEPNDSEDGITIITYVDKDGDVIGRSFAFEEDIAFSYGYTENKGNFGFEMKHGSGTSIVGKGTTGKKLNGTFTLTDGCADYITITVMDLDMNKLEDGYICGTFDIFLNAITEDFDDSLETFFSLYDIRVEVDSSKDKCNVVLALMSGDSYFAKITIGAKTSKENAPAVPSDDKVILVDESFALTNILGEMDLDALIAKLKDSVIPDEYVSVIEQYIAYIELWG